MSANGRQPPLPGTSGGRDEGSTVAGLAREVEALQRRLAGLVHLPVRVERLAETVTQLADTLAGRPSDEPSMVAPSWLAFDPGPMDDTIEATDLLTMLAGWVAKVYLRYSDARLPECWLWHPDVVEELLWLHAAWISAYDPAAAPTAVGDWHDRQRPGVLTRIKTYTGRCSLDDHRPGRERHTGAPTAPTVDAVPAIAAWWALARTEPAPAPTDEQVAAAAEAWKGRTNR
jgi:hypothetical protein